MAETTTIEITKEQARELDQRRDYDTEPYKSVIARLLGNGETIDSERTLREIKNELSMANEPGTELDVQRLYNRLDDLESSIPSKTVDELEARQ